MIAYSEVIKGADPNCMHKVKNSELGIKLKNLKKFMVCVLKLALQSGSEIMLDFSLEKLAAATAEKCFENQRVDKQGVITLD